MLISSSKYQSLSLVAPLLDVVYVILLFDLTRFYHVEEALHFNEKRFWAGSKICMQNIMFFFLLTQLKVFTSVSALSAYQKIGNGLVCKF